MTVWVVAKKTVDVVTVDCVGQLRLVRATERGKERLVVESFLPDSVAVLSPPAISSRLEMEGSEGFCSSAGGEGGDWGCCRW